MDIMCNRSVLHSFGTRGLIVWPYRDCFPFSGAHCSHDPFSVFSEASTSTCLQKGYKVDDRAKKAALFFPCEANPDTRLSIPAAMRAKGYSDVEAADQILVQQVRRKSQKNKPKDTPCPKSAAASLLQALATFARKARPALCTITPNPTAAPVVTVGGINAGILPSLERKVKKTSHQEQIGKQNKRKCKAVHPQAHACMTTLVAEERAMPKGTKGWGRQ
jgi:hypothetical protein